MEDHILANHKDENSVRREDFPLRESFAHALASAEERVHLLQRERDADQFADDILNAARLVDELKSSLSDLEEKFSDLSDILQRLPLPETDKTAQVIGVLSGWLNNISRMKADAATRL